MTAQLYSQRGASLILGLLITLAITLLTLVTARASLSQNQALQAKLEFRQAFSAADSALRTIDQDIFSQLQLLPCEANCLTLANISGGDNIPRQLGLKDDQWWQASAQAWLGGWRLSYLQTTEQVRKYDETNAMWIDYQREIYTSYFYQPGFLPGNRVLLQSLWLVDRPLNNIAMAEVCLPTSAVKRAWREDQPGICGRLAWEQLLP